MKYRKKPIVIEAYQLPLQDVACSEELIKWLSNSDRDITSERNGCMAISTLEGTMIANPGDWIIKGIKGESYPCKPDIFEATYEAVE